LLFRLDDLVQLADLVAQLSSEMQSKLRRIRKLNYVETMSDLKRNQAGSCVFMPNTLALLEIESLDGYRF